MRRIDQRLYEYGPATCTICERSVIMRDFIPSDEMALRRMHAAQGFDYTLPDLLDPRLWITQKILADRNGNPEKAILGRLTSEAMFLDYPGTENEFTRMRRFMAL